MMIDGLPNFLIIGAARSGTTWLAKNMALHPEIFMPHKKEIHFFDKHYDKGLDWYKLIFQGRKEKAIGEATPAYLYSDSVPMLIHECLPGVRLIVSLRNPIERAYSHYLNLVAQAVPGEVNYNISFEDKLCMTPRLIETGMYATKLKRYFNLFSKENILVLLYDDLMNNAHSFLERVYMFLEVNPNFKSPLQNQKVNAASFKLGNRKILYNLHRFALRLRLYKVSRLISKMQKTELVKINMETKKMLLEKYFITEIYELEKLIDRDLSAWKMIK